MQSNEAIGTPDATDIYAKNRQTLLSVLNVRDHATRASRKFSIAVERILVDRTNNAFVPYGGEQGIEALLHEFSNAWQVFHERWYNGHLMCLYGALGASTGEAIRFEISLGPGGQITCKAGPTTSLVAMLEAFDAFDRQLHVVSHRMGCDYVLLAEGYNPLVRSPLDVALVPRTRWTLLNAHLGQTGRYARDAMRCECSTHIKMDLGTATAAVVEYQTAVALAPILMFLTDNVRSFRAADALLTQRMTRSLIWDEVDVTRCGVVPGTFYDGFCVETYANWLEGLQPITFVDDQGTTSSTGKKTLHDVMQQRELSRGEVAHMITSAFPLVRLFNASMELFQADSMRPRMAVAYLAFVKGLFGSRFSVNAAGAFLGKVTDRDVEVAITELQQNGWNARIYGKSVGSVVDKLLQVARNELDDADRRILNEVAEQWDVRMVPRDTYVHQAIRSSRGL